MVQHVSYHGTSKALSLAVLFDAQNGKLAAYRHADGNATKLGIHREWQLTMLSTSIVERSVSQKTPYPSRTSTKFKREIL